MSKLRVLLVLLFVLAMATIGVTLAGTAFAAAKEKVLHRFQGGTDAAYPQSNLLMDAAGNLYGETVLSGLVNCGGQGCGTIFKLSPTAAGWKKTTIYQFTGGSGGDYPSGGLISDAAGNLYGTTEFGGDLTCGCGMAFELSPAGGGTWKLIVLHNFVGGDDGGNPLSGLVFDRAGNLYGTTYLGGGGACNGGFGCCGAGGNGNADRALADLAEFQNRDGRPDQPVADRQSHQCRHDRGDVHQFQYRWHRSRRLHLITNNTCGASLASGGSCAVSVAFRPMISGTRKASLNVGDDGGGSPQTANLTGIGG